MEWTTGTVRNSLAAIVCLSLLSGCESLPDVPSFDEMKAGISETYDDTVKSIDQAWNSDSAPAEAAASEEKDVVVSLDRAAVKRLQQRLAKMGYSAGRPDGIMGAKTKRAIRRYQSAHNMPVTGQTSLNFLEHLEANADSGSARDVYTSSPAKKW